MTCIRFTLLCRAVPFAGLRLRLCQRHVEHCRRCQQESEGRETLPPLLVTAGQLPPELDLWPEVHGGISGRKKDTATPEAITLPLRRPWRWAYAAAMALLLAAAGYWVVFHERHSGPQPQAVAERPELQTRVCSARIENRPARIILIQSRNPDRTIFWIAKNNNRS
jgi:hypothetical protein